MLRKQRRSRNSYIVAVRQQGSGTNPRFIEIQFGIDIFRIIKIKIPFLSVCEEARGLGTDLLTTLSLLPLGLLLDHFQTDLRVPAVSKTAIKDHQTFIAVIQGQPILAWGSDHKCSAINPLLKHFPDA